MQEVMPGIIVDPLIKGGKPVIKGTRVPVELIEGKIAGGLTYEEIMAEYDLKKEDILAALHYVAFTIRVVNKRQQEGIVRAVAGKWKDRRDLVDDLLEIREDEDARPGTSL